MVAIRVLFVILNLFYQGTADYVGSDTKNETATLACRQLQSDLGDIIVLPSDGPYSNLSDENWSATAWREPSCIAVPKSASDVGKIITVLAQKLIPFAIRSGGHDPNPANSNIDNGVLIANDNLNQVTYDASTGLASIGPGARWDDVYTTLDPYNLTVVGGRVMDVGVGGLVLGGGLSYLSDLYGLVCDNVVSFEVVLADGNTVEASLTSRSDLFWALKGGTNNFGVVTKFMLPTFPIQQVWGGMQLFDAAQQSDVFQALYEYQTTPDKDLYANLIIDSLPINGTVILTLVYLKPVERPEAYAPFYKLTPTSDQTTFMTLHELMAMFSTPALPRWTWYMSSFQPESELFDQLSDLVLTGAEVDAISKAQGGTLVCAIQPINENVVLQGQAHGGNALGLEPVTQTWFSINAGWLNAEDDEKVYAAMDALHNKFENLTTAANAKLEYFFMNDANIKQPVIASYGEENVRRLREVQKTYDPNLVFHKLVPGGQKIPLLH